MESLVFTTFADEQQAAEALTKLNELDKIGDIIIYKLALIKKDSGGDIRVLHHTGPDASNLPSEGVIAGSLIGALAGPLGVMLGAMTGAIAGSLDEDKISGITEQFVDKAGKELAPGSFAIVTDLEEDDDFIVNSYMKPYHGVTLHSPVENEADQYDRNQWEQLNKEIEAEEAALEVAEQEDRAAIESKLEELKKRRIKQREIIKEKAGAAKKHFHSKLNALQEKLTNADHKVKEKLNAKYKKLNEDMAAYDDAVAFAFD